MCSIHDLGEQIKCGQLGFVKISREKRLINALDVASCRILEDPFHREDIEH